MEYENLVLKLLLVNSLGCYESECPISFVVFSISVLGHAWLASLSRFLFVLAMKAATAQRLHLLTLTETQHCQKLQTARLSNLRRSRILC